MMKKMMMGFGVLNLTMMIRGSIRGAPKIHGIFYISTYITFSPAINTGKDSTYVVTYVNSFMKAGSPTFQF